MTISAAIIFPIRMNDRIKKLALESLKDQRDVFGDDLFESLSSQKKRVKKIQYSEEKKESFEVKESATVELNGGLFKEDFQKASSLKQLYDLINTCEKCTLGSTRTNFVFGVGNPNADLLLIGEAPGAEEDKQGIPFVGRAGKLLTDILKAINFERDDVYIANILKCRPPNNRDPFPAEREMCIPYLHKQISLINPKIILCLGRIAANTMLGKNETMAKLREQIYELNGIKVMVTYHPAALLRNPGWKRGCWEDVKKVRKLYDQLTTK